MAKRFTDNGKWKKRFFKTLSPKYKLLWIYILDDCDHAGIWEVDMEVAQLRIGEPLEEQKALELFKGNLVVIKGGDKWFIPDFITFQYGELNPNSRVHKSVLDLLEKNAIVLQQESVPLLDAPQTLIKNKRFKKPSVEQIKEYCIERKNVVDAESFFNYYESKGWKVGKSAMKDWKSAVRTWEKNNYSSKSKNKIQTNLDTWSDVKSILKQKK